MCRLTFIRVLLLLLLGVFASGCASTSGNYASRYTGRMSKKEAKLYSDDAVYGKVIELRDMGRAFQPKPYFIEFRARGAVTYGHASVVFGKLDRWGRVPVDRNGALIPSMTEITGLHPASATMAMGHVLPVPALTGPSDGDHEDAYIKERYRIDLTVPEFARVVAVIKEHKRKANVWHGLTANCVTYVHHIAKDFGLKTPSPLSLPPKYVAELKRLNG